MLADLFVLFVGFLYSLFNFLYRFLKFWLKLLGPNLLLCILSLFFLFHYLPSFSEPTSQTEVVVQEIRAGGQERDEVRNHLAKKKYFQEMLAKHFPDFESRVSLEKRQAVIYQKAGKKIKEYQRLCPQLNNYQEWLTAEEKLSIDYFHGTGIYAKLQDSKTPPNIFDTRKSFLKKMENQDMREKFLETYNRVNSIE